MISKFLISISLFIFLASTMSGFTQDKESIRVIGQVYDEKSSLGFQPLVLSLRRPVSAGAPLFVRTGARPWESVY